MQQRFRLTNDPGGLGVGCDSTGLTLAGVALLQKGARGFEPRTTDEIEALLEQAYPELAERPQVSGGLEVVADALNAGDLTKAMIAAVFLRLPELNWDAAVRVARTDDTLAKQYDAEEPRDERGRWTVGQLIRRSTRKAGLDTRQLAADLAQQAKAQSREDFAATLRGVQGRLSAADRTRLQADQQREVRIAQVNSIYSSSSARTAGERASRILETAHGMLTANAVKQTLLVIHAARVDPASNDADRTHLLPLYYDVYSRGAEQGLLGTELSQDLEDYALASMAYDNGALAEHPSSPAALGETELIGTRDLKVRARDVRENEMLGLAPRKKYRKTFFQANPHVSTAVDIHHAIPQWVLTTNPHDFSAYQIHSLENLRAIPNAIKKYVHESITKRDNEFRAANPNPTKAQILAQAKKMDRMYGEFFSRSQISFYPQHFRIS